MKRTFLVLVTLFTVLQMNAQKIQVGVKAGVNLPSMTLKVENQTLTGGDAGFHIGPTAHISVTDQFAFQPSILFNMRKANLQEFSFRSMHIDLPLTMVYTHQHFFAGAGPNISYGLNGKVKMGGQKADMYDVTESQTLAHKRLDVGAHLVMGYNFPGGFQLSSFFTGGITDIYEGNGEVPGVSTRTRNFGLSFGYLFPIGKKK